MHRTAFLSALLFAQAASACPVLEGAKPLSSMEAAAPAAFVDFDDPTISTPFEMTVEFCGDAGEQIATMAFDAIMPAHQHGMNYRATVAVSGERSFRASNIVFHMPGLWELRIEAETAGQKFNYTGEVLVE